ncbi:hypothetical protein GO755_30310 [Spirosoma sp. HMF4905]|uniref:Uncharacterized protein n=1 Tax=Spirosoma arboris TaxID=2682092 RepID=A0A7K1SKS7_9BACT|nr:hypothetical protein [Spirosoma arboris]
MVHYGGFTGALLLFLPEHYLHWLRNVLFLPILGINFCRL